jgi:phosphomannomutase
LPEFNFCREGILTSGLIASMLGSTQFNDVLGFMGNYKQIREKTNVDSSYHDKVIEKVAGKLNTKYSEVITLDGIKGIIDEDSWVLIRKSNTEDIIRISAESNSSDKCKTIVKETTELVNQCYEEIR